MYTKLVQILTTLKGVGAVGIKTSFEDEGARPKNVRKLRNVSHLAGLDMNVKIGGPEAKTDFYTAIDIGTDGIVAPMIESSFALSKFTDYSKDFDIKRGINIESKQGLENLELGGAGLISATVNITSLLARDVYESFKKGKVARDQNEHLVAVRKVFDNYNLISALHSYKAEENSFYNNIIPPLQLLSDEDKIQLFEELKKINFKKAA